MTIHELGRWSSVLWCLLSSSLLFSSASKKEIRITKGRTVSSTELCSSEHDPGSSCSTEAALRGGSWKAFPKYSRYCLSAPSSAEHHAD